jgi:hypothetical protein
MLGLRTITFYHINDGNIPKTAIIYQVRRGLANYHFNIVGNLSLVPLDEYREHHETPTLRQSINSEHLFIQAIGNMIGIIEVQL